MFCHFFPFSEFLSLNHFYQVQVFQHEASWKGSSTEVKVNGSGWSNSYLRKMFLFSLILFRWDQNYFYHSEDPGTKCSNWTGIIGSKMIFLCPFAACHLVDMHHSPTKTNYSVTTITKVYVFKCYKMNSLLMVVFSVQPHCRALRRYQTTDAMHRKVVAVLFLDTSLRQKCLDIRCHDFSALQECDL